MVWINQIKPFPGQLVDAAYLNAMRDNLLTVRDTNISMYRHDGSGSNWTSTSAVMTPIDNTLFNRAITTQGGPVMAIFYGVYKATSGSLAWFGINRVGDDIINDEQPLGLLYVGNSWKAVTVIKPYPDLPAGTYNFRPLWRRFSGAGTMTLEALTKPWFAVIESL